MVAELCVTCGGFVLHPSWKLNMFALCFDFVTRNVGFGFMYAFHELFSRLYIFQSYFCFLFFLLNLIDIFFILFLLSVLIVSNSN